MARWLVAIVALLGCVDHGPGPQGKKIDPSYVAGNLLKVVPADIHRFDVDLGPGKVVYAGNRVDKELVAPGGRVRVTHVWQVVVPPGPGWRVFAFVRGEPNTADFMNLDATDMEIGHPIESWQAGEVIQDVQDITLRPDWKSRTATLYVGLIRVGKHGLGDRMMAVVPGATSDGKLVEDDAVVASQLGVDLAKAPPPPGTVYVPHAVAPIVVDGVGVEAGWGVAATSPDFTPAEGSPEPIGRAYAKMTWDEQNLYLFVSVTDSDIVSQYKEHDQPLWKEDAVELFIDADGNRRGYVELQVNPNNATFDSWFATTRAQPGDEKWDSGMQTAVKLRGTTEPGDTDQGWDVEIAIPWQAVKGRDENMNVRLPPRVGDRWRLNVVRVDAKTGGQGAANGGASSWNRITMQDFHALDRMLTVVFADRNGSIIPTATQEPEPAAGSATGSGSGAGTGSGSGSAAVPVRPVGVMRAVPAGSGSGAPPKL